MSNDNNVSRRDFLQTMAGVGVAGLAGSALMANEVFAAQTLPNRPDFSPKDFKIEKVECDVLVIGSGIAGVFAAVKAHDKGAKVHLVSKGCVGRSGMTPFGKGLFNYEEGKTNMSKEEFLKKVAESSINTNNPVFTKQLLDHSAGRIEELKEWGFFNSNTCGDAFMSPLAKRKIGMHERVMVTHLLKDKNRIIGASGFSIDESIVYHFHAKTTILCCGAGAFKPNGFPMNDLTHDGSIMAYKAGAKVTGKEWNDGHPASAKNSGSCYDNWNGQASEKPKLSTNAQVNHHLGVDLNYAAYVGGAPVARGSNAEGGPYVPAAFQMGGGQQRGPQGEGGQPPQGQPPQGQPPQGQGMQRSNQQAPQGQAQRQAGAAGQPPRQGGPDTQGEQVGGSTAGMSIHKSEGILPVNEEGLSTIAGLYAAGDALGSYLSGAIYTQIGSSMTGSAVQGAIAGEAAARDALEIMQIYADNKQLTTVQEEILAPIKRQRGFSPAWVTQVLQGIMIPNFILYIQKENLMKAALAYVEELQESHVPMLIAKDLHTLRLAHETENMVLTAQMKLEASIMRKESRCSHYRLDYPKVDTKNWNAWINIYQDSKGKMKLEKQAFSAWPKH